MTVNTPKSTDDETENIKVQMTTGTQTILIASFDLLIVDCEHDSTWNLLDWFFLMQGAPALTWPLAIDPLPVVRFRNPDVCVVEMYQPINFPQDDSMVNFNYSDGSFTIYTDKFFAIASYHPADLNRILIIVGT